MKEGEEEDGEEDGEEEEGDDDEEEEEGDEEEIEGDENIVDAYKYDDFVVPTADEGEEITKKEKKRT